MLDDRDYMRDDPMARRDRFWDVSTWGPVKTVIVTNVVVFVLQHLFKWGFLWTMLPEYGGRYVAVPGGGLSWDALKDGHVWTLVTHLFVHSGFEEGGLNILHLFGNMLMVYFAGRRVVEALGARNFYLIYFLGGIAGAVLQLLLTPDLYLIGASAAAFALLLSFAAIQPEAQLLLFIPLPIQVRARTLGRAALILSAGLGVLGLTMSDTSVLGVLARTAHFAHLGGALFGLFYMRWLGYNDGHLTRDDLARARRRHERKRRPARVIDVDFRKPRPVAGQPSPTGVPAAATFDEADYDRVLDKIRMHGMASLTARERAILEEASADMRARDREPNN